MSMFNVELPPDSSWKWSTGITTEDQNEIQRLEKRIQVLEAALRPMLSVCKDPKSYDLVRVSEIISKALEVKP